FIEPLVRLLVRPLRSAHPAAQRLIYTNLPEAFVSYFKVALLAGLVLAFPVIVYQIWMFVAPGLLRHEKRVALAVVGWGGVLFVSGVLFAYGVVLPQALHFLLSFAGPGLTPQLKLDAYLTFVARSCLAFGLAFELPFLMVMAVKSGLLDRNYFARHRKYSYIGICIIAFLLVAGDLVSTVLVAVPLCGLYEAGGLIGRMFGGKQTTEE
ncbi:MAG: Twin-arginine translocation protein TatB, partial [uncultured bacterium]